MKNILILILFPVLGYSQYTDTLDSSTWAKAAINTGQFYISGGVASMVVDFDCEYFTETTPWAVQHDSGVDCDTTHQWVYADKEELNTPSMITTADLTPCGKNVTEHKARICAKCLRHETCTETTGFRMKTKESEYQKLKLKIKQD